MPPWRNVLVYADGRPESSLALAEAVRFAEHVSGNVTALDVLHYYPARVPRGLLAMDEAELLDLMREQRREQILEEVDQLRPSSKVHVEVTHGNPAFELIRQVARGKHDLVVKTARGRDTKHRTSFGSTALHLVRKSPAPVLLVSPRRALLEAPKILCALELDDNDTRHELNCSLLAASRHLGDVHGAELHVVHVVDQKRADAYRGFVAADAFERFVEARLRLLQSDLEALLTSELREVSRVHAHLLEGDPADHLVNLVHEGRFSHLVMGSIAHLGAGHLIGSLIEDVLTRVECSVLTLKPTGFVSPVDADHASVAQERAHP
jgi:universal stress protein E